MFLIQRPGHKSCWLILFSLFVMEAATYQLSELVKTLELGRCTTVHACENHIGDHGCDQIALALAENSSVLTLRLNDNSIADIGAGLLAEAIQNNKCLLTISLTRNRIGPGGAVELATCLRFNAHLTKLDLGQNCLGDEGARNLAQGLSVNSRLLSLDLHFNQISHDGGIALASAISSNIPLRELHLRDNRIDDAAVDDLADSIPRSNLVLLDLSFNRVTRDGWLRLIEGVEESTSMTCLSVQGLATERYADDLARLNAALQKNKQTMVLTVEGVQDEKLHVSIINMSGRRILDLESDDLTLQQLYIAAADAVGQPSDLNLIDAKGQLLPDSPDLVSQYLAPASQKGLSLGQ